MRNKITNWSGKTNKDLEIFFSTDIKNGLSHENYARARELHGENIIEPQVLQVRNFFGMMEKKALNYRALFTRSIGILGAIYIIALIIMQVMGFGSKLFFVLAYIFLVASALALFAVSERNYYNIYKMLCPKVRVKRYGEKKKVSVESLVPGDIIILSKGSIVPADAKIIQASNLSCMHKFRTDGRYDTVKQDKTHMPDGIYAHEFEPDILYASDIIESGRAVAVIFATGSDTLIAKYKTPLLKTGKFPTAKASTIQENAARVSRALFLSAAALSVLAVLLGILGHRDLLLVFLTCMTVAAAAFSEQLTIIIDFALTSGMIKSAEFGAVVKKTEDIDKLNKIDMLLAKKTDICAFENLRIEKIFFADKEFSASYENRHDISYVLSSAAAVCFPANSATAKAVLEAADYLEINYREIKRLGEIEHAHGLRSATVLHTGVILACFGEAENIIEKCAHQIVRDKIFEPADIPGLEKKLLALYDKYDLVMAVALKELSGKTGNLDTVPSGLDFYAFIAFSEEKSTAVRVNIEGLKNFGITPVMVADSGGVYTYKTAVNLGVVGEHDDYFVISNANINNIYDLDLRKLRIVTRLSQTNNIKLLQALSKQGIRAAITADSVAEAEFLNEGYLSFCTEDTDEALKNKSSVTIKNMSLRLILRAVKNAGLIYKNALNAMIFCTGLFISQYLLIFFAAAFNGAYILNPAQIIWAAGGAGFFCAAAVAANGRSDLKKRRAAKNDRQYFAIIRKHGLLSGLVIFLAVILTFFISLGNISDYIGNPHENINAQTAAFLAYIAACFASAARFINIKNKIFITAAVLNIILISLAMTIKPVREYLGFGNLFFGG